jgi:hypothetical protein
MAQLQNVFKSEAGRCLTAGMSNSEYRNFSKWQKGKKKLLPIKKN